MSTINAQTIINEVMAAHAIAPIKKDADFFSKIKIKTSDRGFHTILNCKENLQRFADMVRKNATAFGGGLIREAKQKPAISWPANLISLFKQSIEDHDYQAALDIGDKLGALFFVDNKGHAQMQVAPVPCEFEPRLSSVCNENGTYAVIFQQNMTSLSGASVKAKRSRQAQIDNVQTALSARTEFNLSEALDKQSYSPVEQAATRAQWIMEHGLSAETIEARIVAHEVDSIEAMAAQDVAKVVAQAVTTIAISEAMQGSETGELVTCEAGESEAHAVTVGSAPCATWAPVPQYVPCPPEKTGFNDGPAPAFRGDDGDTPTPPPAEFFGDATPPVAETPDTLESFDDTGDGVSDALYEAVQSATIDHVQALTDAQFSKLYDHLENWNFHTENLRLQALRTGVQSLIDEVAEVIRLRDATGCGLSGPLYDRYMTACRAVWDYKPTDNEEKQAEDVPATHNESDPFPFAWPLGQKITSKSGRWSAYIYKWHDGKFCLEFKETSTSGVYLLVEYDTPKERMTALQALARAADAPTDTPPCGEPCPEPVAGVKPATPPAVDVNEWGPAIGERYIGAVEYAVQEANKRGDGFEYRTGENALMERRKLPAVTQASAATQTAPAAPTAPVATSTPGTPPAVSSEFKRVGNVRVDLGQMVAQGARPESLIGLGVYYEGNMANPSGYGAITATDKSDFHGLTVDVTLESGMVWRAVRASEFKEGSFYLDAKLHGAPYMAELAARVAAIKANASASKEIAATAHAKALVDLAAQYPQLKRAENTYAGGKLAAVNMRILLKAAFSGCKFSVTSDHNSVRVNWTDGPSDKQVNEIVGRFDIGASDSQSDYFYTVSTAFSQLFGGVQYLFTRREVSDSLMQVAIDRLYADRSEKPTVTDYRKCTGIFDWNSQDYENRRMREMLETLGK